MTYEIANSRDFKTEIFKEIDSSKPIYGDCIITIKPCFDKKNNFEGFCLYLLKNDYLPVFLCDKIDEDGFLFHYFKSAPLALLYLSCDLGVDIRAAQKPDEELGVWVIHAKRIIIH